MFQPAKLIIINSVLIGAIRHYLSVFRIPTTIVNKIDSIMASFFFGRIDSVKVYTGSLENFYILPGFPGVWVSVKWDYSIRHCS